MTASVALNTRLAYESGIKAFQAFRFSLGLPEVWPPSIQTVVDFISYLSLKGAAASTARSYLSGIGYRCKILGVSDTTQCFLVKKLILGMSRSGSEGDKRLPITIDLLQRVIRVLPAVCSSNFEAVLFASAFTVAYFGFFRIGELVVDSSFKLNHALDISNVKFGEQDKVLEVLLPHSKTDQTAKGCVIALSAVSSLVCPVTLMKAYLAIRPKVQGPLYRHFSGAVVTRYQFSSVLKKALKALGIDSNRFKSHSFRIGAATSAASKGFSEDGIKQLGRWESKAYKSYIRIPTTELL